MNKGNKTRATILMGAGVLLMIAAVAFFIFTKPPGQTGPQTTPTPNTGSDIPYPDVPRITVEDAKAANDQRAAVFVDTRSEESWALMSIPGAINIPWEQIETRYTELDPDDWIILYCTWPDEETSAGAAQILMQNGFKKVHALKGGLQAWADAGYLMER